MSLALPADIKKKLRVALVQAVCSLNHDEVNRVCAEETRYDRLREQVVAQVKAEHANADRIAMINFCKSVEGNLPKCGEDLKDDLPLVATKRKLDHFHEQWVYNKTKSKRAKHIDSQDALSKLARKEMDLAAMESAPEEALPEGDAAKQVHLAKHLARTKHNDQASITIGLPPHVISYGKSLGKGAFGIAQQCTVDGVSYLPAHITYVAKKFTGGPRSQYKSWAQEASIDLPHRGIVRSIAHTNTAPWVLLFPFFNGGTLGDFLELVPAPMGTVSTMLGKFDKKHVQRHTTLTEVQRLSAIIKYAPSIIHALVQTLLFAHSHGVLHNDLHVWNVVIDITKEGIPRVGIIDWGMALRINYEKKPSNVTTKKEHDIRPWRADELCDATNPCPYSTATDTYALAWLIRVLCASCNEYATHFKIEWGGRTEVEVKTIESWMPDYLKKKPEERKTLADLNEMLTKFDLRPEQCLRPMSEMTPAAGRF